MGIDWFRFRVKPGVDSARFGELIERQAMAFQTLYGFHDSIADEDRLPRDVRDYLHFHAYRDASTELSELVELPAYDDATGRAADYPELDRCWRIYPVTHNATFPPLMRVTAGRTYLADEVRPIVEKWRAWADGVRRGQHDDYLKELHWYETTCWARFFWNQLHDSAVRSFADDGSREPKPGFLETRDRVLRLPRPHIPHIRRSPTQQLHFEANALATDYPQALANAQELIETTAAWNRCARKKWRLGHLDVFFTLPLDEFRKQASSPRVLELFDWTERSADLGFGLYLDY